MSYFSKVTSSNGVIRYRDEDNKRFMKSDEVPEEVKKALESEDDGVVLVATETSEGLTVEKMPETNEESDSEDEATPPDPSSEGEGDSQEDVPSDEESSEGLEEDTPEEADSEDEAEASYSSEEQAIQNEQGMGFPMDKNGKTLSVFSKKPHEVIKYVGGVVVPMTKEEYDTKSDMEIIEKLQKMGKL